MAKLLVTPPTKMILLNHHSNNMSTNIASSSLSSSSSTIGSIPTMKDIMETSRAQNLDLNLQNLGPFFRITAKSLETKRELGRAEGVIRVWLDGKILHLDSIKLNRESMSVRKSIFGVGLFLGAVAVRHGFDSGCQVAQLLAINDTDVYHSKGLREREKKPVFITAVPLPSIRRLPSPEFVHLTRPEPCQTKLVRFYSRMGFKTVHEVDGSSIRDLADMLVWGGKGTRMDANVEELLVKWCSRFKSSN